MFLEFLKKSGFITDSPDSKQMDSANTQKSAQNSSTAGPLIFPVSGSPVPVTTFSDTHEPLSKIEDPIPQAASYGDQPDPAFVKFYEDELQRTNLPGPDYFEFRQQIQKMNEKMAGKGASQEVILTAVLASFDAQNVSPSKLIEAAKFYKDALEKKRDSFLGGARTEKNNQLKQRETNLQNRQANIQKLQSQIQSLEQQLQQTKDALLKEQTQVEADKTLGQSGIEKIERAEKQVNLAYEYITSNIDADITKLQNSNS